MGKKEEFRGPIIWGIICFILALAVETTTYLIKTNETSVSQPPTLWSDNIMTKCPDADLAEAFYARSEI